MATGGSIARWRWTTSEKKQERNWLRNGPPAYAIQMRFAFLEGGVAWGCSVFADLISHWEKRNGDAIHKLNPANLNRAKIGALVAVKLWASLNPDFFKGTIVESQVRKLQAQR